MTEKINISSEELASTAIDDRVAQMRKAQEIELVRAVGTPAQAAAGGGNFLRSTVGSMLIAGIIGGGIGWMIAELFAPDSPLDATSDQIAMSTAAWTALVALGMAAAMSGSEAVQARSGRKLGQSLAWSLPLALAGGAIAGYVTQKIYESMIRGVLEDALRRASTEEEFTQIVKDGIHLPRGLGFAIFGAVVGLALGASTKSGRRAVNGLLGGAAGGFVGGFVFDFIEFSDSGDGGVNRLVALLIMGLVIGLAIGLIENARKEFWVEILSGGMAGKQFILYHESTTVGSSPDALITLIKDPNIAPEHLVLRRSPQGMSAVKASGQLVINGYPSEGTVLGNGDLIQLGETVLRFGERAPAPVPMSPPVR